MTNTTYLEDKAEIDTSCPFIITPNLSNKTLSYKIIEIFKDLNDSAYFYNCYFEDYYLDRSISYI
jgi:hypothetical protein